MRRNKRGGHGVPAGSNGRGRNPRPWRARAGAWRLAATTIALALAGLGAFAGSAGAEEEPVSMPGSPLTVSIGPLGQCESSYSGHGNNFFPPFGNLGDCGFFLAFPTPSGPKFVGQPVKLQGTTWGFKGSAGPHLPESRNGMEYVEGGHSAVTGSGTAGNPYTLQTKFFVTAETTSKFAEIVETTTYVNGEPQFISTFNVKSLLAKGTKLYFRAIYAGDMYLLGNDFGTGVFLGGPPRFVGGQNPESGSLGGLVEASGLPWSAYQEGCWNETIAENPGRCSAAAVTDAGLWNILRTTVAQPNAYNNTIDAANIDNGVGAEWDQLREVGLEGGAEQAFTIINRSQVPSNLQISPVNQTLTQAQTATITVTSTDLAGV